MKLPVLILAALALSVPLLLTARYGEAIAQEDGASSPPGTSRSGMVTPAPNQQHFGGVIGSTIGQSLADWPKLARAPEGAPNILLIMLDDVGFAQLGSYGAHRIQTPNIDRLAKNGLRYSNFHTTPLCSPTRAAILTGRNHHSVAMGVITELSTGFPGYNGRMPLSHGMLSEVLMPAGWSTFALGKWHLTPVEDVNLAASRKWWPLGRGFDRYYGFLGGTTSRFIPWLTHDNHFVRPPATPKEGYHLLTDMVDKAREYILDVKHIAPDRPFFMYFSPGGTRAPHHVPEEWIARYKGQFDEGWDHYREQALERQIELGIAPAGTKLSPRDPSIPEWKNLTPQQRNVFAHQMEVFAAYVSFVDHHVGQLVQLLEELGQLDNTLILVTSDNGASIEGGPEGSPNEVLFFNNVQVSLDTIAASSDKWGGPETFPIYAAGWAWAGNTPFLRWKRDTTRGGTAEPMIVHWPAAIKARGEIRTQFTHAIDVVPTVLDLLDMEMPASINGVAQAPMEGVSFASTFANPDAELQREAQYFEMAGRRAIYHDGWRAYAPWTFGQEITPEDLADPKWMLFNVKEDFSESTDVADKYPEKLEELRRLWWTQAGRFNVLPLDGRAVIRQAEPRPQMAAPRSRYVYHAGAGEVSSAVAANVLNRSHTITADVVIPDGGAEGVLLAQGGRFAGYSFFVKGDRLHYVHNYLGLEEYSVTSSVELPIGAVKLRYEFERSAPPNLAAGKGSPGIGRLYVDGSQVAEMEIPVTVPLAFSLSGEGLCVGWDSQSPAASAYHDEFPFSGTIRQVVVDLAN
jgi:arylsulfatase A-like enzyme